MDRVSDARMRVYDETISLSIPARRRYTPVARAVVAGLGARLDLSFESLDDLQLAVEALLAAQLIDSESVTLELGVRDGAIIVEAGPVRPAAIEEALQPRGEIGLGAVLAAVVDRVVVEERDGASWLRLEKNVPVDTKH